MQLGKLLDKYQVYISFITELGLLSFLKFHRRKLIFSKELIDKCFIIQYSEDLKDNIILLKRKYNLKIPDAIIAATAYSYFIPLLQPIKIFLELKR